MAAGRTRRGFPTQLMKLGLILSRELTATQTIYGLSKKGAALAGVPKFDIHKVSLSRFEHALTVQEVTLSRIEYYDVENYEFEPQELGHSSRPDVVWYLTNNRKWFFEIELSSKSIVDGELDRFFLKLISRYTIVVFRDQELLRRYVKHAFRYSNGGIPEWEKVDGNWVLTGEIIKVARDVWNHVSFQHYPHQMSITLNERFENSQ
jgi:hypothetical protein